MPEVTWDPAEAAGLSAADYELLGPNGAAVLQQYNNHLTADPLTGPQTAPEQPQSTQEPTTPEEGKEPAQELPEASEEESKPFKAEEAAESFFETDYAKSKAAEFGGEEVFGELIDRINELGDDAITAAFLESAAGDGIYAEEVLSWAKVANDAGAGLSADVEPSLFTDEIQNDLRHASEHAEEFINLNKGYVSGEISKTALIEHVMVTPGLLQEAQKLRSLGLISF